MMPSRIGAYGILALLPLGFKAPAFPGEILRKDLARFENGDPGWKARMEALVAVAKVGRAAVPVLDEALRTAAPPVREFAAQALSVLADPGSRPALLKALRDPEPRVRVYAIKALSMLGPLDPNEEPIRTILGAEADWEVRRSLTWALERDDPAEAAAAIRTAVANYDLARMDTARLDDLAPDFTLTDSSGRTLRLSDFLGKKNIVLKFYHEPL